MKGFKAGVHPARSTKSKTRNPAGGMFQRPQGAWNKIAKGKKASYRYPTLAERDQRRK